MFKLFLWGPSLHRCISFQRSQNLLKCVKQCTLYADPRISCYPIENFNDINQNSKLYINTVGIIPTFIVKIITKSLILPINIIRKCSNTDTFSMV